MYADNVIKALAVLRSFTGPDGGKYLPGQIVQAVNALDNAGVFAALDEQTDYASAEDVLAEHALMSAAGVLLNHEGRTYGYVPAADRLATMPDPLELLNPTAPDLPDLARAARFIESLRPKGRPADDDHGHA